MGWLVTKSYETTTTLYYTFFLPGVFLHEFIYWLAAGMLNVRAERSIAYPEKQEIGELKLNFVRLSKKASPFKVAIINSIPPIVGLAVIWIIAVNIFDVGAALETMSGGQLDDIGIAIGDIVATADFWLWTYLVFTISNTMLPSEQQGIFQGLRPIILIGLIITGVIVIAGFGDEFASALIDPIVNGLNGLSLLFVVIMSVNVVGLAILSLIENTIERVTGDSATFKNGKMIAMRRQEVLAQRKAEREKARKAALQRQTRAPALPEGPPSVYKFDLPIPGAPGQEPVTQQPALIVEPEAIPELDKPRRDEPSTIPGEVQRASDGTSKPATPQSTIRFGGIASSSTTATDDANSSESTEDDAPSDEIKYEDVDDGYVEEDYADVDDDAEAEEDVEDIR